MILLQCSADPDSLAWIQAANDFLSDSIRIGTGLYPALLGIAFLKRFIRTV